MPQNDQIWPKIGIFGQFGPGHLGFFGALLVGQLAVVARGLYLARHLFTLCILTGNKIPDIFAFYSEIVLGHMVTTAVSSTQTPNLIQIPKAK